MFALLAIDSNIQTASGLYFGSNNNNNNNDEISANGQPLSSTVNVVDFAPIANNKQQFRNEQVSSKARAHLSYQFYYYYYFTVCCLH